MGSIWASLHTQEGIMRFMLPSSTITQEGTMRFMLSSLHIPRRVL